MSWKIEKWFTEVFPGEKNIYSEYRTLKPRELVIIAASVLDLALAELISMRLINISKEFEDFLGLNGNGLAPCSTFGARIQLALLIGIINQDDAAVLRTIKNLRNLYAHKVNVSLSRDEGLKIALQLLEEYRCIMIKITKKYKKEIANTGLDAIKDRMSKSEEAACAIILTVFAVYQAYFHRIHVMISRIQGITTIPFFGNVERQK